VASIEIHTKMSGVITSTAKNANDLKQQITNILDLLINSDIMPSDDPNRVSKKLTNGKDARTIIAEAFDDKKFFELRADFGKEIITGFARLNGRTVGLIASDKNYNQGRITSKSAYKATALLSICTNFGLPVVNIVDCAGVINNLSQENYDLIRNISDMLFAYNICDCAKITLISGQAIGIGYTAFANKRTFDYSIAWNGASIGMLSDIQSATLVYSDLLAQKFDDKQAATSELAKAYGKENSSAAVVAESGYIDNVINPAHTRQYLIAAVEAFADKR
jgi:acetyl-CoA carboxylase carboxyltransferase component